MQAKRDYFYETDDLIGDVEQKLEQAKARNEPVDYLTFVPDGEPTLDVRLGEEIERLQPLGVNIAVITNSSLLYRQDVRRDLARANWISLKIDAISEATWHQIDRPHKSLQLAEILQGMLEFAHSFHGEIATETMLIQGMNDSREEIEGIANFLERLQPDRAYLAIPTRPPAKQGIQAADEQSISMAYHIFSQSVASVEYLIGYEGSAFAFSGDVERDLLGITSVHPMRAEGVDEFLRKASASWDIVRKLIDEGKLVETEYLGDRFYMRKLPGRQE